MSVRLVRTAAFWTLVVLCLFNALAAVGGGVGMVAADGLSMPKSLLLDSPFSTFTIPGLILIVIVGGTQVAAATLLLARRGSALLWAAVAGFGMVIWIISEIGFIHSLMWAQMIFLVTGLSQLVLVIALLGVVSWLPREDRHPSPSRSPGAHLASSRSG